MPISIVEALYYNLAVVLSKSSSATELSRYVNLIMVEPMNVDSLEAGLMKSLDSSTYQYTNQTILDLFDWNKICSTYIDSYK